MAQLPRVLVIGINFEPETTGIAPYTAGMCAALSHSAEVHVLTTQPHYPQWRIRSADRIWSAKETIAGARVHRLLHYVPASGTGVGRILSELSFATRVLLARPGVPLDAVVVVSPALLSVAAAAAMAKGRRIPLGIVVQDLYSGAVDTSPLKSFLRRIMRAVERWLLRQAASLVIIHPSMQRAVTALTGSDRPIRVVRNWTRPREPTCPRELVRSRLGWGDEAIVLHTGNMGWKQNLENVVETARLAEADDVAIRFIIVGDGNQRKHIETLARDLSRVEVLPPVPEYDYPDLLNAADVLLVNERPGLHEMCSPSKLTSYLGAGRPVLVAAEPDSAAAVDLFASAGGEVVPPGIPSRLLDAALRLASSSDYKEMGARGRRYAQETLSYESAAAAYRDWLGELLSQRNPSDTNLRRR